jgi:hypothetical protein
MAVNLYNASVQTGLFNILGGAIIAQADINTSRGNTIPNDLVRLMTWFDTLTPNPALEATVTGVEQTLPSYVSGATSSLSTLQQFCQSFTIAIVAADKTQPDSSLKTALSYIIAQMQATGQTINRSTVSATISGAVSNSGNGVILVSTKRGDGLVQENSLSESIAVTSQSQSLTASLAFKGQAAASSSLGQDWPKGSACNSNVTSVDANSSSLVSNGGMETQATLANVPDSWTLSVGTPGTHCLITTTAQQTVTISGTPTGGGYILFVTDNFGKVQSTAVIAYNATATAVQSALRALTGFGSVTVSSTGSSPNYQHTIVFTGAGGDIPLFSYQNLFTGGTSPAIAFAKLVVGTPQVFAGNSAVQFKSDGSKLTTLNQKLTLSASTAYAISLWACCDSVPAAGVVTIDLVDGIGGTVLTDAQGVANSITFNASALLSSFQHLNQLQSGECFFRTPATLPTSLYLRIRISTAVTSGKSVFIDNVGLTAASQIYAGGPYIAAFAGNVAFSAADAWTLTVTNARQGQLREWLERNFSTSSLGLLFPTSASPTIPDSTIVPYAGQLNYVLAANSQYLPALF